MTIDSLAKNKILIGIDVGSTTAKLVVIKNGEVVREVYERHMSQVRLKVLEMITDAVEDESLGIKGTEVNAAISGSAGLGLAESAGISFVQEVFATGKVVELLHPETASIVELGGEDAKIIFYKGGTDERMNGSCAGGTGAFIDQMATLLNVTPDELDELSLGSERIYPIASRCGVFAKTDIQPLLNQGADKKDISASIYQAVVNQTIAGLAQGRKIEPPVMFLGGPLYFCKGLRRRFCETLGLDDKTAIFPEYGRFAVALGAALYANDNSGPMSIELLCEKISNSVAGTAAVTHFPPLFETEEDYMAFSQRHKKATVEKNEIENYSGRAWLGIDCGSTTTKLVLIDENNKLIYTYYSSNMGNPVEVVLGQLKNIYKLCGDRVKICGAAVTGYGEELICNAFGVDTGLVETIAHFTAARYFNPDVDFILDIGGQDIKCFKIKNNSIDSIMLNEACSSGCGSFLETFAKSMGYTAEEFASLGLKSRAPVNLGSRCTVFMNSSVKQAQKDGVPVEDISAGLSVSVVKNAIYKVIRASDASELGRNVVVQGGTFYNDAVLRAFEKELGVDVVRPEIAGLMGAYGAALYEKQNGRGESVLLSPSELETFEHKSSFVKCGRCENHCSLTVNTFSNGKKYITGNRCEKGSGIVNKATENLPNLHQFKRDLLSKIRAEQGDGQRGTIGLPLALGMYELAPFWHEIFTKLGFKVILSDESTKEIYLKGQFSIPSDTACYPAKLMHGHIATLIESGVDAVFYPSLTYNFNEKSGVNHYNCPVVAYYSEIVNGNTENINEVKFLYPFLNINNERQLAIELYSYLSGKFPEAGIKKAECVDAVKCGMKKYRDHMNTVRAEGERAIAYAREKGLPIMILAGRPYHADGEVDHGIDKLANSLGFAVLSEDSVSHLVDSPKVNVLDQWTYHQRLYKAARFCTENDDCQLVQLVSFGCGVDAITTDEIRSILEDKGKLYTQLKIDEIANLGAVKIRLRSLIGAIEERKRNNND